MPLTTQPGPCLSGKRHWLNSVKILKIRTPEKNYCNCPKIWLLLVFQRVMRPKNADAMANIVDPDQTAPPLVFPDPFVRKLRIIMVSWSLSAVSGPVLALSELGLCVIIEAKYCLWMEIMRFCLFVLRFYSSVNTIKVMSSWTVNQSSLFLGRLPK